MRVGQSSHPGSTHRRADESLTEPIDLLRIEKEFVGLVEDPAKTTGRVRHILQFILRLTNGLGISYLDISGREPAWHTVIWREPDSGFNQPILEELSEKIRGALSLGTVVISPLEIRQQHYAIIVPLHRDGRRLGVVSLILVAPSLDDIQPFAAVLQASLGFMHYALLRDAARAGAQEIEQTAALVELNSLVASAPFFEESLRVLAETIRKHLGCHQVAVGAVRGRHARLRAVSGAAQFDARGNSAALIEAAMEEALLFGGVTGWPPNPEKSVLNADLSSVAQQELQRALEMARVCSVPLCKPDGQSTAVLTLMWREAGSPAETGGADRFIAAAAPHLGATLDASRRADPRNVRKWWHHVWGGVSRVRRALYGGLVAAAVAALAWPVAFPVRVDVAVEPVLRRVVSAQFDGILRESLVKPGDTVKKGDLLAVMDDKQLRLRQAELIASRDRAKRQRDLAMADPRAPVAAAQMAQLEAEGFEVELRLLEIQQSSLELHAPIDGMVLVGDLERAQGIPVSQGDVLFEIGPVGQMVAELMIPAYDISLVAERADVSLRLASFPGEEWTTRLRKIRPQAETVDGKAVFVGEADLVLEPGGPVLRPGMKGRAVIRGETAPLGWVLTRRLWGFLRTTLFW